MLDRLIWLGVIACGALLAVAVLLVE